MEVRIQSIQFDATNQLRDFIQKKVAKLEKFYDDVLYYYVNTQDKIFLGEANS